VGAVMDPDMLKIYGPDLERWTEVYQERNAVVVALARMAQAAGWTVGQRNDPASEGWPVLYIDTPEGQVSWHLPQDQMPANIPPYNGEWDGHTTDEKYDRLARLQPERK
jgi:hypothetical protein